VLLQVPHLDLLGSHHAYHCGVSDRVGKPLLFACKLEPTTQSIPQWCLAQQAIQMTLCSLTEYPPLTCTSLLPRYGDVHPVGAREKVLGMLVMVLGPFLAGYITSSISTVMNIRNTTSAHVAAKKQVGQGGP
jgi:hypothetical protein